MLDNTQISKSRWLDHASNAVGIYDGKMVSDG